MLSRKIDSARGKKPNFTPPKRDLPDYPKITDEQLDIRQPKDNFDRSQVPEVGQAVSGTMPELYRFNLDNGIKVLGTTTTETPTIAIQVSFPAGSRYVPSGKEGLADLTAAMLQEGTTEHTSEQLQQELDNSVVV